MSLSVFDECFLPMATMSPGLKMEIWVNGVPKNMSEVLDQKTPKEKKGFSTVGFLDPPLAVHLEEPVNIHESSIRYRLSLSKYRLKSQSL